MQRLECYLYEVIYFMSKIFIFLAMVCTQLQATQLISYVLLICFLIFEVVNVLIKKKKIRMRGIWFFIIWALVSLFMTRPFYVTQIQGTIEFFWLTLGLISALLITVDPAINRLSIVKIIMYTGLVGAALNVFSYFTGIANENLIASPYAGTRAMGGFDSPNEMGTFYLMIFALSLGLFVEGKINKKIFFLSFAVIAVCIYYTFSRGTYLGLGGLLLVGVFYIYKTTRYKISFTILVMSISVISYKAATIWLFPRFAVVREKAGERGYLFEESWRMLKENPIFGTGLGSFSVLSPLRNDSPHNDFLAFMVSGGLIGLIFIIVFLSVIVFKAFKMKMYPELFLLLAFISQTLTFNHLIRGRVSILFWIIIVVIYSQRNKIVINKKKDSKPVRRRRIVW